MREIGNDLQAAKGLLEQLESKLSDLNELDVFEDKYPNKTPSENATQTISKIETWFEANGEETRILLKQSIMQLLGCYQRLIFLDALRFVAAFKAYKEQILDANKLLPKESKKDTVPFSVNLTMRKRGITISWRRLSFAWNTRANKASFTGQYLTLDPDTYSQKASDFSGCGEHKNYLSKYFDAQFARFRKESADIVMVSGKFSQPERTEKEKRS